MKNVLLTLATVLSLSACNKEEDKTAATTAVDGTTADSVLAQDATATTVAEDVTQVDESTAVSPTTEVTPAK
jgi:hypothetical protein